ncbi:hypothetical protein PV10_00357 [Exophiala mesophila]|uniref:Major facilitator superfamily (MFS) profile domain-containing protein n=1 Tax=Exophiala mesophila TaxID=212818 RepID=A0A0D1X3W5_EXOME|nr:uncharacterized protein PV10_00357 [Exophiala mesophila]KIV96495.1 hypothetical protein PV10_00357 [Exophiala mesophila]
MGFHIPRPRRSSPFWQNVIAGFIVGITAGIYLSLNVLGAGGGRPNSAKTIQIANATACTVWFFSSFIGGSVLNVLGPALTGFLGCIGYIIYVGALWYFDQYGHPWFPYLSGVLIGASYASAGLLLIVMGYIAISYSEEKERGMFVTITFNIFATGCAVGSFIPLIINRSESASGGCPTSVYISFVVIMTVGSMASFLLLPPEKIIRESGEGIVIHKSRPFLEEVRLTIYTLKDWRLWLMIPAFIPGESYLVYSGSVNAYHNNLRTRCLLGFMAIIFQIIFSIPLMYIFDHQKWKRRTRALVGLAVVAIPLLAAWVWEVIRVRNYDRNNPPVEGMDWTDPNFAPIFILFVMNFVSGCLWTNLIYYFLGTLSNDPRKAANYTGVFRAILGAGEAVNFGVDSIGVPYIKEAGTILAFFVVGAAGLLYLALFEVKETMYFEEEDVVVPSHVIEEAVIKGERDDKTPASYAVDKSPSVTAETKG